MAQRRPIVLLLLALVFVIPAATLGGCYAMASAEGHLPADGSLPAISLLGDKMPEHALFASGFALLCVVLVPVLLYRAALLESTPLTPAGVYFNWALLVSALVALPCLVVMGAIPTSSSAGSIHLGAAAIGLVLLALYLAVSSVWLGIRSCATNNPCDASVPKGLRIACYIWSIMSGFAGPALFGVWITDVSVTIFEWVGVALVFMALLPFFVYFAAAPKTMQQYEMLGAQ